MSFKSGFISIVGRPNAGKSTLINAMIKHHVAIVTEKPQTTRDAIIGVLTEDTSQMIFIDTPGIHKPQHELGTRMNAHAYAHFSGVDVIYYVMDVSEPLGTGDQFVMDRLKHVKLPVFLILNKVDLVPQNQILERIVALQAFDFAEIIPISAKKENNLETLKRVTLERLPEGPMYYPKDTVSAYPEQFIIAEIIREKVIKLTQEELPHSVAVTIERIERSDHATRINAVILVNRDSQKGMIIGKQGAMIKAIGQQARPDIETILGEKVYLETYVRVEKNWRNKAKLLNQLGYVEPEQ